MKNSNFFGALLSGFLLCSPAVNSAPQGPHVRRTEAPVFTQFGVLIDPSTVQNNFAEMNFNIQNPNVVALNIQRITANLGLNGTTYFSFDNIFEAFNVAAGGAANPGFSPVTMTQGEVSTLAIILEDVLDVQNATIQGTADGVAFTLTNVVESDVTTGYSVAT